MKGPRPTPTRLKILNGNPGKRPLPENEPQPERGIPQCPEWLDEVAKAKWADLVPALDSLGLLTVVDGDMLAGYCVAWSELAAATALLKMGRTCTGGSGGMKPHPAIAMQRSALKILRDYGSLFGLDPSSRCRLDVRPQGKEEDAIDAFLSNEAK